MVYTTASVRVSRFAQGVPVPDSLAGGLLAGGSVVPIGGSGTILPDVGIPGVSPLPYPFNNFPQGPFQFPTPPGVPPGPVGPNGHIIRASVPKPVNPGMQVHMIVWFATAIQPGQYAIQVQIPAIGYDHTTPYVPNNGPPTVLLVQNDFQLPADTAAGDLQGTINLLRTDASGNVNVDDTTSFTLTVEVTPTQPDGCPVGAIKDVSGVCHCTDPTKELVNNSCVPMCGSGQHRDGSGNCVPDSVPDQPCPTGQHKDTTGVCVDDITPCPTGQHRDDNGSCVPDSTGGGDGGGTTPPPSTDCFTFQGKQYCKSDTPKYGCVKIGGNWYCPPDATGNFPGHHRHNRRCFRHNGIRYCQVSSPPAGATNCITVRGMTWCPQPNTPHQGGRHCPTGQHFSHCTCNCVPDGQPEPQCIRDCTQCAQGQRFNWCTHTCIPATSMAPDCPPDDDSGDDSDNGNGNGHGNGNGNGYPGRDDSEDDFDHGPPPVPVVMPPDLINGNNIVQSQTSSNGGSTNIISTGNGGSPNVIYSGPTAGAPAVNVQNIINQVEGYVHNAAQNLVNQRVPLPNVQIYATNLRQNIYDSVRSQLRAAGLPVQF